MFVKETQEMIEQYMQGGDDAVLSTLISGCAAESDGILGLVVHLGPYLTSVEKETRCRGTRLLASSLRLWPSDRLLPQELPSVTEFFCDRSKDHYSVVPEVLNAFVTLTNLPGLPSTCVCPIVNCIFQNISVQTLIQSHRYMAFQVVGNLLHRHLKELQSLGAEFPLGFIQIVDGEKDPRNLMLVFALAPAVINSFPIGLCTEDLFEVTSCYFPIDFTPPANDPYPITRQQLADALRSVMTSTPVFAPFCLALLVEKLSSELQVAKQDSLRTLADCCQIYNQERFAEFLDIFSSLLIKEVMLTTSPEMEQLTLQGITAIAKCLSRPTALGVMNLSLLQQFCKSLMKDCKRHLMEPEHKLMVPSARVLQSLVASSPAAASLVLSEALPVLLNQICSTTEPTKHKAFLEVILQLCSGEGENLSHKRVVLPTLLQLMGSSSLDTKQLALRGVGLFSSCIENVPDVVASVLELCSSNDSPSVRDEACLTMARLCAAKADVCRSLVIVPLCESLISISPSQSLNTLKLLSIICQHVQETFQDILVQLIKYLARIISVGCDENLFQAVLTSIHTPLASCCDQKIDGSELFTLLIAIFKQSNIATFTSNLTLTLVGQVVIELVNTSGVRCAELHVAGLAADIQLIENFHPVYVKVIQALLCSLSRETVIDESSTLQALIRGSFTSEDQNVRLCCNKAAASIINKSSDPDPLLKLFETLIWHEKQSEKTLQSWAWVSRALVLRYHKSMDRYTEQMLLWMTEEPLSHHAADGFRVLLQDAEDTLTLRQHAVVKLMYKQRLFITLFPKLQLLLKTALPDVLPSIYLTITHLIKHVPPKILGYDQQALLSVLVKLLTASDSDVLLKTLQVLSDDTSGLISQHVDTILPSLLKLIRFQGNMKVRIASLQCISSLAKVPAHLVSSYLDEVIQSLAAALDDHKRLVRKEAVKARNIWCLLRDAQ